VPRQSGSEGRCSTTPVPNSGFSFQYKKTVSTPPTQASAKNSRHTPVQIVKTYSDAANERLKNRGGLKQLLQDAVQGQSDYRVVLV
jgi:hypothetical protein